MIRRPPRSTLFPYDALPISTTPEARDKARTQLDRLIRGGEMSWDTNAPGRPGARTAPRRVKPGPAGKMSISVDRDALQQRSEEHTSELQSQSNLVCRLLLEK